MPTSGSDPSSVEEPAEARQQLTATALLLRVISSSPKNLQPRSLQRAFAAIVKFTDRSEVRGTAEAVGGHFNVSVSDTGPGIPVEHQTRHFEEFHQVDGSNTKVKGGRSLGLAIAKQIAGQKHCTRATLFASLPARVSDLSQLEVLCHG
jgi:light-regulated signal transduction histidine kinase (bacteriophytochrome)